MRNNVYKELQYTIHFTNRSGVRAKYSDCHKGIAHELPSVAYTSSQSDCVRSGLLLAMLSFCAVVAQAKTDKPNILVIWSDDIGWSNISAYHRSMLGGRTPNIDRLANEGAIFTDGWSGPRESLNFLHFTRGA